MQPRADDAFRFPAIRATVAIGVIAALLFTLLGRVYWLQSTGRERIIAKADRQQHLTERLAALHFSAFSKTTGLGAASSGSEAVTC